MPGETRWSSSKPFPPPRELLVVKRDLCDVCGPPLVKKVSSRLENPRKEVRRAAHQTMRRIVDKEDTAAIVAVGNRLSHRDHVTRLAAMETFLVIRPADSVFVAKQANHSAKQPR